MKLVSLALAACSVLLFANLVRAQDKPAASQPSTQPAQTFEVSDTDALKAAVNKTATVHGTIARTAWSPRGSVMFINFQGVDRDGFTVIVRKEHKDALKDYGEDAADLNGKEVSITGKVILYKDKPEIEISKADQIKVAAAAASQPVPTPPVEPPKQ